MARQRDDERWPPLEWDDAPPDAVARLGRKLRKRRQRRVFLGAATAAVAVLAAGGGVGLWWLTGRRREFDFGDITCSEVMRLAEAYRAGRLDAPLRERVERHIALCPMCRPLFEPKRDTGTA
jgi:hypothetical protein